MWRKMCSQAIQDARENASFNPSSEEPLRNFAGLISGVSFGGGQKVSAEYFHQWNTTNKLKAPGNLQNSTINTPSSHHSSLILLFKLGWIFCM